MLGFKACATMHGKGEGLLPGAEMTQTSVSPQRTSALETDHKSGNLAHCTACWEKWREKINSGVGEAISVVGTGIVYVRTLVPFPAPRVNEFSGTTMEGSQNG